MNTVTRSQLLVDDGLRVSSADVAMHYPFEIVGRENELEALRTLVNAHRLVTVVGSGGIGKTRLCVALARSVQLKDGWQTRFVNLTQVATDEALSSEVCHALGLVPCSPAELVERLPAAIGDAPLLIVLDDFDRLLDHVALLSRLVRRAPAWTRFVVSARSRLHMSGEVSLEVHGLPHASTAHARDVLSAAEHLFVACARRAKPFYELTEAEWPHVQRICQMADGMPLAIELAAAWVSLLPTEFIASQISHNLDWLSTSVGMTHRPTHSVRAVFDSFWALMSGDEQLKLERLSVFADGFDRSMAQALTDASLMFLSALVDRAMLSRSESGRYALHELVRQYAAEKLERRAGAAALTYASHANICVALSEQAEAAMGGPAHRTWLDRMEAEHSNIRGALSWAVKNHESNLGLRLATATALSLWDGRGYYAEGVQWLKDMLSLPPDGDTSTVLRAKALVALGWLTEHTGDFAGAEATLNEVLQLALVSDFKAIVAKAMCALCFVTIGKGDFTAAAQIGAAAEREARACNDPLCLRRALRFQGIAADYQGDIPKALTLYEHSLALAQAAHDASGVASCLNNIGSLYVLTGDFDKAEVDLQQSLKMNVELKHREMVQVNLSNLGKAAYYRKDFARAIGYYQESIAISRQLGSREATSAGLIKLGNVIMLQGGDPTPHYQEGLRIASECRARARMLQAVLGFARLRALQGQPAVSVELIGALANHSAMTIEMCTMRDTLLDDLRRRLSVDEIQASLARGGRMKLPDVVARLTQIPMSHSDRALP